MNFKRGQIIHHNFALPGKNSSECHPVLIISNETVTNECDMYVGLMITSSDSYKGDDFTYELDDKYIYANRLTKTNKFIRLHLVAYFTSSSANSDIKGIVSDSELELILDTQRERVFTNY